MTMSQYVKLHLGEGDFILFDEIPISTTKLPEGRFQTFPDISLCELMHCHCVTNNTAPRWTFTDLCKPEMRPGAREESASPAWLAASDVNARDTTKVYIWRLDNGCRPTLYGKCYNHNTPGKKHNNT